MNNYARNLRVLAQCQARHDNMLPPEYYEPEDRDADGLMDDDYEEEGYER